MLIEKKARSRRRFVFSTDFFEDYLTLGKFKVPKRFLLPMITVLIAKVLGAVFLFYILNIQLNGTFWSNPAKIFDWPQNHAFLATVNSDPKWPLTFEGWDGVWYLDLMTKGYSVSPQSYTFSPGLPLAGNLFNIIFQSPSTSLVVVTFIFGILWIPLYQMFAEYYISKKTALFSALLIAFSPYLFVFTTVTYSEGLMLFFIIGAWVLVRRGKIFEASFFAILAPLTRTMGIVVFLPMLYYALKQKTNRIRNVVLSFLPVASLGVWFAGLSFSTGVSLAPITTTEWSQMWSVRTLFLEGIPRYGLKAILEAPYQFPPITTYWLLPFAVVVSLIFPVFICYKLWTKDKSLWLYGTAAYLGVLCFGAIVSTPRFISVIFPFWIILSPDAFWSRKSIVVKLIVLGVFYVVSLSLWMSFLNGQFIA